MGKYLEDHAKYAGALDSTFSVEIYGTIGAELQKTVDTLPFPVKVYKSMLGYSRV